VNVARAAVPAPFADVPTGIGKVPVTVPVQVREPGAKGTGLGSGLVGDVIGDGRHHGGTNQAVYAFAREQLDVWAAELGRPMPNGYFGENLTLEGIDVDGALLGERWQVGETVVLQVTAPRVPCRTFRGWVGERGWLKRFTEHGQPGAYLRVIVGGTVQAGDEVRIVRRPDHQVSVALAYQAVVRDAALLPRLLAAGDDLIDELRGLAVSGRTYRLDP
jgi:MOSC domain-containing protein YiiM